MGVGRSPTGSADVDQYLPLAVMMVLATVFAGLSFLASGLLGPRRPTLAKLAPYECGIVPEHEPADRFPVRFYLVAMIFIIFDIEIIFLYPWAVIFHRLGGFGLAEMLVFAAANFVWVGFAAREFYEAKIGRLLLPRSQP